MAYYDNVNVDLLARIPLAAGHLIEVGCGAGNLARAYKARNPDVCYVGVELFETAGRQAAQVLDHVVVGNIESAAVAEALAKVQGGKAFDTLIFGDVLEHLQNPWQVLADLRAHVAAGGVCVACIPNVSHWTLVQQLLKGRWDYVDQGLLDRTHLRFFTLESAVQMFQQAGWTVVDAYPRVLWPEKTRPAIEALRPVAQTLGIPPAQLERDLSAFQWVIRAVNGPAVPKLNVTALSLRKQAGVSDARIDYPLAALNTLPSVPCRWQAGGIAIPAEAPPGVFVLHRQFLDETHSVEFVERQIQRGWVVVSEFDDDPRNWPRIPASDFAPFRRVHAVTVSTEPLAAIVRQWNPNVQVFANAIFELPEVPASTPKQAGVMRVFFGALNRGADWAPVQTGILAAANELGQVVEFIVVHDRAVYDTLPETVRKSFHPTLPHEAYMKVLATCDLALLPLADTEFNRLKSDLKFIECCAAGVVPICSPVVYRAAPQHHEIGIMATGADEWQAALLQLCRQPEEVARRRARGLQYVKKERMHSQQVAAREHYYRTLFGQREALEAQRQARIAERPRPSPG